MTYPERFDAPEADAAEQAATADPLDVENEPSPSGDIDAAGRSCPAAAQTAPVRC
jgi:hypothetical protein